ncbi:MAG: zinc ribbon domain-containing protein, partial [Halolamina sp.]
LVFAGAVAVVSTELCEVLKLVVPEEYRDDQETAEQYVEYKAPESSVAVEQVEPAHTSQRCSHTDCGFTHEDNRDGERFHCLKCGYEVNADYNPLGRDFVTHHEPISVGSDRDTSVL